MPDVELYRTFARYNQWMNGKLYDLCAEIDDTTRKQDRGAFFRSIHGTLNHILFGDRAWMSRFTGRDYPLKPIGSDLYEDFADLRAAQDIMNREIVAWSDDLTEDWLKGTLTWQSSADGVTRSRARWLCVSHLFNHQTHHRGQATTLLSQLGYDVGPTDLPWTPGL